MDYKKFIQHLPSLYKNWGQDSVRPKSARFEKVLDQVQGMTNANVMQLLNFAVECMEPNEIYCEVGTFQGATLIGAMLDRPNCMAYAVDNFSQFDVFGVNQERLMENLNKFGLQQQVIFYNRDFEEFLLELKSVEFPDKIGVYFYDGAHDYRSQLLGLFLIKFFLADRALIVVDDSNWIAVQQANWDFIAANPKCKMELELLTPTSGVQTFCNGLHVLSWDVNSSSNYSASTFVQLRQQPVIQAIHNLRLVEPREEELNTTYQEALALHQQQQFSTAEMKYKEFLLWRSDKADAWLNLGILYCEIGNYHGSLEAIFKSIEKEPSKALSYYSLGVVLEKTANITRAILAYGKAIALDPTFVDACNNLGNLLAQMGEISQAEVVYSQGIAANPSHFGSYLNLGNLLVTQNQIEQAIEVYQTALMLNPGNPDILNNLEIALNIQKNPTQTDD
jgi:protein O-GlcNAc transferase